MSKSSFSYINKFAPKKTTNPYITANITKYLTTPFNILLSSPTIFAAAVATAIL